MQHPVVWFEVLGADGAALRAFYGELFGWKIDADNPVQYGTVDTGTRLGIPGGVGVTPPGAKPWVTFYVASADIAASLARAEKLGGKTLVSPRTIPGGPTIAVFEDPAGNPIGLVHELQPSAA